MNAGKTIFSQLIDCLPWSTFAGHVTHHRGDHDVRTFPCTGHFRAMGLCPTDFPGKPARHRSASVGATSEALAYGLSRTGPAIDAGRCQ